MSPQAKNKTVPTNAKVSAFLAKEKDAARRADCETLVQLMTDATGEPAVMWGTSIIGFGRYHYRYDSGREGDSFLVGFAPRKGAISIYAMGGVWGDPGRLAALGKCKVGGSCLYVNRLSDINASALTAALKEGARRILALYPPGATTTPALRAGPERARAAAKKKRDAARKKSVAPKTKRGAPKKKPAAAKKTRAVTTRATPRTRRTSR